MQCKANRISSGRRIALILAAISVTACGSESNANAAADRPSEAPRQTALAESSRSSAAPQAARAAAALPIERGIYAEIGQGCTRSTRIFFYDGAEYGEIGQARPEVSGHQSATPAYSDVYRIERVGSPAPGSDGYDENFLGFTRVWNNENAQDEFDGLIGIRPSGSGRFTKREGGYGATGAYHGRDDTYQKCNFAQLSPQMQAAVRAERASLAGGPPPVKPGTPAAGKIAFPPIEKGYYAINMNCAQAIADGGDMIAYFDEKRFGAWDGFAQIQGFESLGGNRYRVDDRSRDENGKWTPGSFVIIVNGRTGFTREEDGVRHHFCPASQVPASIKQDLG